MMAPHLLTDVLSSILVGRRKRSRRALRYLTGQRNSFWSHPSTLLTAAGVAWGIYETLQNQPGGQPPPPLPPDADTQPAPTASDETLRIVQLAVSAAYADGTLNDREEAAILQQARAAGVGDAIEEELQRRRPLAEIVAGVTDPAQRATLYVLAFTILRADEQISGAERIYLAQLAHLLGLDPAAVQALEKDTGERIDALGDQGQLGG